MKRIILINILLLAAVNAYAQVQIGEKAPAISVDKWINNSDHDEPSTAGKAIVLDFWFTNCGPCIYTIPHLNDLTEEYKNENISFISITYENEDDVSKFLSKKKILAHVGTDTAYQTINKYEVKAYPTTFLIDENGILKWRGHPSLLTSDMIDALLHKKRYPQVMTDQQNPVSVLNKELSTDHIYPITVSKNNYMNGSGMQFNLRELSLVNQPLDEILTFLLQKSKSRISITDQNRYDVRFKFPEDLPHDERRTAATKSLLNELDYQLTIEKKEVEGYVLKILNDSLFIKNAIDTTKVYSAKGISTNSTYWEGNGVPTQDLVGELEDRFKIFVIDKTKLNGCFELKFPIKTFDVARSYLLDHYGLALTQGRFEVEITQIASKHDRKESQEP
ncbi:redoxin domain-containing protein [Echinicola soli]|uniref:Redoxin domain-containing protein n=1 Tax=Echinicola soli TaxID=2591634 RepID=A0A514CJ76_9BACT|nr:redoxin domain-containing protein [Echinicola soli]QDH79826.1 redoxin domain-containing protein [Echinicola soli]